MKQILQSIAVVAALAGVIILLSINHQQAMKETAATQVTPLFTLTRAQPTALLASPTFAKSCNVEEVGGIMYTKPYRASRAESVAIVGWLLDTDSHSVPGDANLFLVTGASNAAWSAPLQMGVERSDVAKLYGKSDAYLRSGFRVVLDAKSLPANTYHLYLVYGQDGQKHICDNGRILQIEP